MGSAAALTDATGGLVSREEYYPFGETSFGSTQKQRYRFCGKELDEESGLYYYGARYYAAWLCRFISVDPLAAKYAYYTPYQYAGNKPVNKVDIDGLEESGAKPSPGAGNKSSGSTASSAKSSNAPLHGIHIYAVAEATGILPVNADTHTISGTSTSCGGYTLTPQFNKVGGKEQVMFYLASTMTKDGARYDYAIGPGKDLQNFMSNHKAYMGYANMINLMGPPSKADLKAMVGITSGRMLGAFDGMADRWNEAVRDPARWLSIATSTMHGYENSLRNKARAGSLDRVANYAHNWPEADLEAAVKTLTPDSKGSVSPVSSKTTYTNGSVEIVYDREGDYFRIRDNSIQSKRKFLDTKGTPLSGNKTLPNGKQMGMSQGEYNERAHYKNIGAKQQYNGLYPLKYVLSTAHTYYRR